MRLGEHKRGVPRRHVRLTWCRPATISHPTPSSPPRNPDKQGLFGAAVACDGPLAVFGATQETVAGLPRVGRAYIYRWNANAMLPGGGRYELVQAINATDPGSDSGFGSAIAVRGDVLAVGAPTAVSAGNVATGAVYLYHLDFVTGAVLASSTLPPHQPQDSGEFGVSLALNANHRLLAGRLLRPK